MGGGGVRQHWQIFVYSENLRSIRKQKNTTNECKNDSFQVHCSMLQVQLFVV